MAKHLDSVKSTTDAKHSTNGGDGVPPNQLPVIEAGIRAWLAKRKVSKIPDPAPNDVHECAAWWCNVMQEPEGAGETYIHRNDGDTGGSWIEGYACRCRNALLRWFDMTPIERNAVCAGVLDDKVPYRGDDFAFYRQVHEETMRMREIGVSDYRQAIARKVSVYVDGMRRA